MKKFVGRNIYQNGVKNDESEIRNFKRINPDDFEVLIPKNCSNVYFKEYYLL